MQQCVCFFRCVLTTVADSFDFKNHVYTMDDRRHSSGGGDGRVPCSATGVHCVPGTLHRDGREGLCPDACAATELH